MAYTDYTNIGLRVQNGSSLIHIGAKSLTTEKLRIRKGSTTYGLPLVATTDADASPIRIYDGSAVKALAQINYPTSWSDTTEYSRVTGFGWTDRYTFTGLYKDSSVSNLHITLELRPSDNGGCRVVVARARCESVYSGQVSDGCNNDWHSHTFDFDISSVPEGLHSWYIQWEGYKTGDNDGTVYIKNVSATLS